MYETATPIASGVAAVTILAYTGAETALMGLIAGAALIAGLVLFRIQAIRRRRQDAASTSSN